MVEEEDGLPTISMVEIVKEEEALTEVVGEEDNKEVTNPSFSAIIARSLDTLQRIVGVPRAKLKRRPTLLNVKMKKEMSCCLLTMEKAKKVSILGIWTQEQATTCVEGRSCLRSLMKL